MNLIKVALSHCCCRTTVQWEVKKSVSHSNMEYKPYYQFLHYYYLKWVPTVQCSFTFVHKHTHTHARLSPKLWLYDGIKISTLLYIIIIIVIIIVIVVSVVNITMIVNIVILTDNESIVQLVNVKPTLSYSGLFEQKSEKCLEKFSSNICQKSDLR